MHSFPFFPNEMRYYLCSLPNAHGWRVWNGSTHSSIIIWFCCSLLFCWFCWTHGCSCGCSCLAPSSVRSPAEQSPPFSLFSFWQAGHWYKIANGASAGSQIRIPNGMSDNQRSAADDIKLTQRVKAITLFRRKSDWSIWVRAFQQLARGAISLLRIPAMLRTQCKSPINFWASWSVTIVVVRCIFCGLTAVEVNTWPKYFQGDCFCTFSGAIIKLFNDSWVIMYCKVSLVNYSCWHNRISSI